MNHFVKNADLLQIDPASLQTLDTRASLHRRYSAIEFKVIEATGAAAVIRITQHKSHSGNFFDAKRLVEITHETFDDLLPGRTIHVRPLPYKAPPTDVVTADWVKKKSMKAAGK